MKSYLQSLDLFSEEEIDEFLSKGTLKKFSKGSFFLKEGGISQDVGFIEKGFMRSFYYNSVEEEVTYCFGFPQSYIADYASFITQEPAKESIQAMSDVEILVFSKNDISAFEQRNNWLRFFKLLADQEFIRIENRFFSQMKESAEYRYKKLIAENPEFLQQIPLNYLASYLGISQRHLTRIRKNIN